MIKTLVIVSLVLISGTAAFAANHTFSCPKNEGLTVNDTCYFSVFSGGVTKSFALTPAQGQDEENGFLDGDSYLVASNRTDDMDACERLRAEGGWCLDGKLGAGVNDGAPHNRAKHKAPTMKQK